MQLDFTHFLSILELISGQKFAKHQQYVDNYVKAYYLPKDLLQKWLLNEKLSNNYSNKQLTGLILCICNNDKKLKQKLLNIIDAGVGTGIQLTTPNEDN